MILIVSLYVAPLAAAAGVRSFSIDSQPLTGALLEFGQQSGYSIGFTEDLTANQTAQAVRGNFSVDTALRMLLQGTGLAFRLIDDQTVAIVRRGATECDDPDGQCRDGASAGANPAAGTETGTPPANLAGLRAYSSGAGLPRESRLDEIIVVGSQLRRASAADALPVTIWDADRIDATAAVHGADLFRALPFAGSASFNGVDTFFAGVNSARGDISSINLRDLGTGNTLVLLNGRRMIAHPGVQTEGRVPSVATNMNVLPLQALSRIEILRDGASAVYGADAVAGVVNNVLKGDFDGVDLVTHYGVSEDTELTELDISLRAGGLFNSARTSLQLFAAFNETSGVQASERWYSRSSDLRPYLKASSFAGDTDFNNSSINGTWGQFQLPGPVRQNGSLVTSPSGVFHLQPTNFDGCIVALTDYVCVDDSFIDEGLYGDLNSARQLIPDLQRSTLILTGSHLVSETAESYGELLLYKADSTRTIGGSAPLPSTPVTIPASNYWNPFGPVVFSDGRPNPNRLPGIDAPAEGMSISLDSSFFGSAYRIADADPRVIDVDNSSMRALFGVRGETSGWHWDSAILYSEAQTDDVTYNRVSNTRFQQSLALETPQAYNPFNGSGAEHPSLEPDGTPNPEEVIAPFLVDVYRQNRTELALADLKLSNSKLANTGGGAVGVALGIEARHEKFAEDRDPLFDGTVTFTDIVTGREFDSDIMGTSVTRDSSGSRNVLSAFGEIALPVVGESNRIPLVDSLEVQLAARYENHDDVGTVFQPRLAVSWQPGEALRVRGSISRGVRMPSLPQINAGTQRRVLTATDWYRCQALLNKGEIVSLASCGPAGKVFVESSRTGSQSLQPENYESVSMGLVITPRRFRGLLATIDYWRIEQDDIVGLFGAENQISVDYVERLGGGENDLVIRAELTQNDADVFAGSGLEPVGRIIRIDDSYVNLDRRVSSGIDFALSFALDQTLFGDIRFDLDATRLLNADQSVPPIAAGINDLGEPAIAVMGAGDLIRRDGRPEWKAAASVLLHGRSHRTAITANYISSFLDTSAINDQTSQFYPVDEWLTVGAFWETDTSLFGNTVKSVRLGVRNLFDQAPPLADESFGYFASMHDSHGRYWYLRLQAGF